MARPPPDVVRDLAASCVQFATRTLGVSPDYTPETLPLLDHYIRQVPDDAAEEVLGLLVPACGAYFGEVARQRLGDGTWSCSEEDYESWRLTFDRCSIRFNPIGVAVEVALMEPAEGWTAEFKVAEEDRERGRAAVDVLGEVQEADYFSFAVRFEVLEQLYKALAPDEPPGDGD